MKKKEYRTSDRKKNIKNSAAQDNNNFLVEEDNVTNKNGAS